LGGWLGDTLKLTTFVTHPLDTRKGLAFLHQLPEADNKQNPEQYQNANLK